MRFHAISKLKPFAKNESMSESVGSKDHGSVGSCASFAQAPNPSFKRTRHGKARLAFISFSAKRTSPRRSA